MLKQNLSLQVMNQKNHCLKEKSKKVIGLTKDPLRGKIVKEFVGLKWLVGIKLIQLEQQKTQLPVTILAKKVKPNTQEPHKKAHRNLSIGNK